MSNRFGKISDLAEVLWALRSVLLSYYRVAEAVRAKWQGCTTRQAEAIQNADPSFVEWTIASWQILRASAGTHHLTRL